MPPLADRGAAQVAADAVRTAMWEDAAIDRTEAGLARLDLQSELLAVSLDGLVLATTPDVLALLDAGSGQVLDLDSVRVGARVAALRVEALLPEESEEYLRRVGPAAYGLELAAGGASKTSGSGE